MATLKISEDQKSAFWSKVDISSSVKECWNWTGAKKPKGYGNVRIQGRYLLAHRVAFELINGVIPSGYIICHICDNPSCCNPHHLMLGTVRSNAADMLIKDRQKKPHTAARGSVNGMSKLKEQNILDIRAMSKELNLTQKQIADKFKVSQTLVSSILRKKIWSHV